MFRKKVSLILQTHNQPFLNMTNSIVFGNIVVGELPLIPITPGLSFCMVKKAP